LGNKYTLLENINGSLLNCNSGSAFCRYFGVDNTIIKNYIGYCKFDKQVLCNNQSDCIVPTDHRNHILIKEDLNSENWLNKLHQTHGRHWSLLD
jgi:hypothetical protein